MGKLPAYDRAGLRGLARLGSKMVEPGNERRVQSVWNVEFGSRSIVPRLSPARVHQSLAQLLGEKRDTVRALGDLIDHVSRELTIRGQEPHERGAVFRAQSRENESRNARMSRPRWLVFRAARND